MSKTLGIEYLPLEVLEVISTYLSAKDLATCIGLSRTCYYIFSNDLFWKRHCMANSRHYFSKTKSLVEPGFKLTTDSILPIENSRLQFLQEQHLWKNWNCGRFKKEEIVFDCDDSISYNIGVSFLDNDHLCLHRTFETEVWNVAETPVLIMAIPHCLKELWECNVYKIVQSCLVVIQCNVVQVYKINLDCKSWFLDRVFFFNKPEEFSRGITAESNVDSIFQISCDTDFEENNFERIVCGQYLISVDVHEKFPLLHVWDIKTGKKIKEDKWEIRKISCISFKSAKEDTSKVLVNYQLKNATNVGDVGKWHTIIYDLSQLQFILSSRFNHNGRFLYFDGHLTVIDDSPIKIILYHNVSNKDETIKQLITVDGLPIVNFVYSLDSNLLMCTRYQIYKIKLSELATAGEHLQASHVMAVVFKIAHLEVLFDRYILFHGIDFQSVKELWEMGRGSERKILEFPDDSGTYVASNNVCSKIVLERGNKLIVLNFW